MTSKKNHLAKAWNEKNHTHFKHLNKADPSTRAKHFEMPMLRDVTHAVAKQHRDSQLVLLTKEIGGRSVTVADIMDKLLRQYENAESNYYSPRMKKNATIARWRYVPNNNMAGRTLAEVRKLRVIRYCSKCLRDILNKI